MIHKNALQTENFIVEKEDKKQHQIQVRNEFLVFGLMTTKRMLRIKGTSVW